MPNIFLTSDTSVTSSGEPLKFPQPAIMAQESEYSVVLKKDGSAWMEGAIQHPLLKFEVKGHPNFLFEVQVARKSAALLNEERGIEGSWDGSIHAKERLDFDAFSSWSNEQKSLTLNGEGKGVFEMPIEWWRDQARLPLSSFSTMQLYYRVVIFRSETSKPIVSQISRVTLKSNLKSFRLNEFGYTRSRGRVVYSMAMVFTVNIEKTSDMYTFVQWKKGGRRNWDSKGDVTRPNVRDYGQIHPSHYPEWSVDRVRTDPRYWDGNYEISNSFKTATATDKPSSQSASAGMPHTFTSIDFDTRVHLNYDVPKQVTVLNLPDGNIRGVIPAHGEPEICILDQDFWRSRILQVWNDRTNESEVSHPEAYAGPDS